jgi:hypothetical protein
VSLRESIATIGACLAMAAGGTIVVMITDVTTTRAIDRVHKNEIARIMEGKIVLRERLMIKAAHIAALERQMELMSPPEHPPPQVKETCPEVPVATVAPPRIVYRVAPAAKCTPVSAMCSMIGC